MPNLIKPKSQDDDGTCPRPTFVFIMPRGCTHPELELTFVDLVYFPDNAAEDI
jgi:hypothetical protein